MHTDNPRETLFNDFAPSSKADWTQKAIADLKGADPDKLVWKNSNGIAIAPYFTREEMKVRLRNTGQLDEFPINYRRISADSAKEANALALRAIREGMSGVIFELGYFCEPSVLLQGIDLGAVAVSYALSGQKAEQVRALAAFFSENGMDPARLKGFVDLGVWNHCVTKKRLDPEMLDEQAEICKLLGDYPGLRSVHVSGTEFTNAGASQSQEMAFTLSAIVEMIEALHERGLTSKEITDDLHVSLGIGSEYFVEISKFRGFQSLLHEVLAKYGVMKHPAYITGRTSKWSKSITDAHTNMLRATTEAMSAILGNASAVEIDPFDRESGSSSDFSRRIAGNIMTILKEESYFDKVTNPVDGSYYVEALSMQLASRALEIFLTLETKGGFLLQLRTGYLQEEIEKILLEKVEQITSRRLTMVGVNKYPNMMEHLNAAELKNPGGAHYQAGASARRAGLELEEVRALTEQLTESRGKRPVVELCGFGDLAMRKARAAFAYDFLGIGGYELQPEKSYDDVNEAAQCSATSDAQIVVLCSSDQDYEDSALQFIQQFRRRNTFKVLLLAGNPQAIKGALVEAGLDGFIHLRSNILETLLAINKKLLATNKHMEP